MRHAQAQCTSIARQICCVTHRKTSVGMLTALVHTIPQDMDMLSSLSDGGEGYNGGGGGSLRARGRASAELLPSDRPMRSQKRLSSAVLPDLAYASARSPQVCSLSSCAPSPNKTVSRHALSGRILLCAFAEMCRTLSPDICQRPLLPELSRSTFGPSLCNLLAS